ncbi:acyltransferase [Robbsia sp. Bb-Pol-6]|uniref:Acyltransferase n=1 Tax=Robbsia betulipollinis TaxID=2981849 RepID=A0ABT3ZV71_9BURK|nr:acyltransferase [Robbsia betulipollinis]MCY0389795.1 acyltransferase [Robbsia betulipollinis]
MTIKTPSRRLHQLDALRGIASCMVVFSHFALIGPLIWINRTPLRLLATGHEAVLLFFVLSGFVLTLQQTGSRRVGYPEYLLKRFCRIYLPYICVLVLAIVCLFLTYHGLVPWAGGWLNSAWIGKDLSIGYFVDHIIFVGSYDTEHIIPVIWSLIYEMRVSIVFPLIVFFIIKMRLMYVAVSAIFLSLGTFCYIALTGGDSLALSFQASYLMTLHYLGVFVVGALLALKRAQWMPWLREGRRPYAVLCVSLALYFLSRGFLVFGDSPMIRWVIELTVTAGAAGIIAVSLTSKRIAHFLARRIVLFLGDISYSLYLVHTIVLLTFAHLLSDARQAWMALGLAALTVIPLAFVTYFIFEKPSLLLGRYLTSPKNSKDHSPSK